MKTLLASEAGSALLVALLLTFMLALIGMMAMDTSTTDVELSYNVMNGDKAFYLAEAGAKRAFATLLDDADWRSGYNGVSLNDGAYSVVLTDSAVQAGLDDTVIVSSTGNIRGAQATVEMTLVPGVVNPFAYAMFGENMIDTRNSMETDSYNSDSGGYAGSQLWDYGDIASNGSIVVHNGAIVGGDAATSDPGNLSVHSGSTVYGDTTSTAPPQDVPEVPQTEFDYAAVNNQNMSGISGSFSYNPSDHSLISTSNVELSSGTYYFSDITLKNSASLTLAPGAEVTLYVTGDIEVKNSAEINSGGIPGDLQIYSQGDIVLKNSGDIAASFYAPTGDADLRNSGEFYGSIVAYDIVVHNSAKFHYDRELGNVSRNWDGTFEIVAWREL